MYTGYSRQYHSHDVRYHQGKIKLIKMIKLHYFLQVDKVSPHSSALLVDPAYHGNVGDNLIAYGELVLMERLGFINHTECGVVQSGGLNQNCNNFSHLDTGGVAWWHGGGNWGDIWVRKGITLR